MRKRDSNLGSWMLLSVLTAAALMLGVLLGKSGRSTSARPVSMTESDRPSEGTNAAPRLGRADGLKAIEEQLSRSFKSLTPKNPSESLVNQRIRPPVVRTAPSRSKKSAAEERNNAMFLELEKMGNTGTFEDLLGETANQGRDPLKLSPMERYIDRLQNGDKNSLNSFGKDEFSQRKQNQENTLEDDSKTPEAIRRSEQALRKVLGTDSTFNTAFNSSPARPETPDLFATTAPQPAAAALRSEERHDAFMKQYRELLNGPAVGSTFNPAAAANPAMATIPGMPSGLDTYGTTTPRPADNSMDMTRSYRVPMAPVDPSQQVLNGWNPLYTAPVPEYKRIGPPKPNFEAPKRRF